MQDRVGQVVLEPYFEPISQRSDHGDFRGSTHQIHRLKPVKEMSCQEIMDC